MSQVTQFRSLNAPIETLTGNVGGAVSPLAGNINILADGTVAIFTGDPITQTLTLSTPGLADQFVTDDTNTAVPALGILNVTGGSNINTTTPVDGGDTLRVHLNDDVAISGYFTAGNYITAENDITSNTGDFIALAGGVDVAASVVAGTFVEAGIGVNVLTGDVDVIDGNIDLPNTTNTPTGTIIWGVDRYIHNYGTSNFFSGKDSGNLTLTGNNNLCSGVESGAVLTTGNNNTSSGSLTLNLCEDGGANAAYGYSSLGNLISGNYNACFGASSGSAYTSNESSNVCIKHAGIIADANKLRIGTQGTGAGEQDNTFIAGIHGVTPGAAIEHVIIDANGEMGSTSVVVETITAGTNLNNSGTATDPVINLDDPITLGTVNATTFDTNVAAAGVTLAGVSLIADGTDANIDINITPKGTGVLATTELTLTTDLACQYGGTGVSSLTQFGVLIGNAATDIQALGVGATNTVLHGNTGANPSFSAVDMAADVTGTLPVGNGGTSVTTFTQNGLLYGNAAAAIGATAELSNGQIPIGSTGNAVVPATLTEGTGISVENGAGSITLSSTKTTVKNETGVAYTLIASDIGKLITLNNAAAVTLTIPAEATTNFAIGSQFLFQALGAGQVTISPAGGVSLRSADNAYKLTKQYSVACLVKIASETFLVAGDLEA